MKALVAALLVATLAWFWSQSLQPAQEQTGIELRIYAGAKSSRPDLLRQLADQYQLQYPEVTISISTGAATSELQRKYLTTLFNAEDPSYDLVLLDSINPAQFAKAGWISPLTPYLDGKEQQLAEAYLPLYQQANKVNGHWVALPAYTDALFLYYRKDLLEKYQLQPPVDWTELAAQANTILAAEPSGLKGLSVQGAPIEGAVCTVLMPYWSLDGKLPDASGQWQLDQAKLRQSLSLWLDLIAQGVLPANTAEIKTTDTLTDFKAGKALFALNWGFAWDRFQLDADSVVKDKVAVMPVPALAGGHSASCSGGGQWAVSAFSRHQQQAAALVKFLSSVEASHFLALHGGLLPVYRELYQDPALLQRHSWLAQAEAVLLSAQSRPVTARYPELSSALRVTTSAVLAGAVTLEQGMADMQQRLSQLPPEPVQAQLAQGAKL